MIPITEFQRRALSGPPMMKRNDFLLTFSRKVREITARYPIKYTPKRIIPDDATADAVFQAGVDLLVEVGLYHTETRRVVQFSREEVEQIAREAWEGPRQETFGKGKDLVVVAAREPGDSKLPFIRVGAGGPVSREELSIPYLLSFAQEEVAQALSGLSLFMVKGIENKAGTVGEAAASIAMMKYTMEVARRVGKPDMSLGTPGNAITPYAIIACCTTLGLGRHQVQIPMHIMPEQQINWSRLQLAYFAEENGYVPFLNAVGIVGAVCRGPEEAAVTIIANLLGQLGYGHGNIIGILSVNAEGTRSTRETLWATAVTHRASGRHIGIPTGQTNTQSKAGAGTEMALYEKAAQVTALMASGAAWFNASGSRNSRGADTSAGLEARFVGETARAVAALGMDEGNLLLNRILPLYEDNLDKAPEGKTFTQLYDLNKLTPIPEYLAVHEAAKERLSQLGINYR